MTSQGNTERTQSARESGKETGKDALRRQRRALLAGLALAGVAYMAPGMVTVNEAQAHSHYTRPSRRSRPSRRRRYSRYTGPTHPGRGRNYSRYTGPTHPDRYGRRYGDGRYDDGRFGGFGR